MQGLTVLATLVDEIARVSETDGWTQEHMNGRKTGRLCRKVRQKERHV